MEKLKFRMTFATTNWLKPSDCLIDSGGTHHFFYDKPDFTFYELVNK